MTSSLGEASAFDSPAVRPRRSAHTAARILRA